MYSYVLSELCFDQGLHLLRSSCLWYVYIRKFLRSETFYFLLHRLLTKLTDKPRLFSRFTGPLPNLAARHSCIRHKYSWDTSYGINYPTPTGPKFKCVEPRAILAVHKLELSRYELISVSTYSFFTLFAGGYISRPSAKTESANSTLVCFSFFFIIIYFNLG
jgi:hypothetical protein